MRVLRLSTLGVLIAGLACASDDSGSNPPVPTSITINGGNAQTGPAGQALAIQLSVIVRDASNNPIAGIGVTWAAATGGGSVSPSSSNTDASGIASTTRTLGAGAGAYTTTATVTGLTAVTFTATATVQSAFSIGSRFQSPLVDSVLGTTVAQPLIAVVLNQSNGPVSGIIVTWTASGGGAVSQTVDTTDAGGESQVDYTFGATAGVYGAQAAVTGLVGSPVSYTLTATPGNPAVLEKAGGDNLTVGLGGQVIYTVTARDGHGNPTNGVTIDWAVATGGGTIAPATNFTGGNGTATAQRTLGGGPGAQTATATATGLSGSPAAFTTMAAPIVTVVDFSFDPSDVTIPRNGAMIWQWQGITNFHNITFQIGMPAEIPVLTTSGSATRVFPTAGTYEYYCSLHAFMVGAVTVTP